MSLFISSVFTYDEDAGNYIQAVETADAQALEPATRKAINNFVIGCKQDGIWTAIKASCILSGARTLNGALMPLTGTAPTNFNFVSGDYNRKTGLVGNATTKYLDSNRNNNADPQDSKHASVWVSTAATTTQFGADIGIYTGASNGNTYIGRNSGAAQIGVNSPLTTTLSSAVTGFRGITRSASADYVYRALATNNTITTSSVTRVAGNILVFRGASNLQNNSCLAFYSIGESLDLALLDGRVTDLINAFAVTIP